MVGNRTYIGTIRFQNDVFQGCDGNNWRNFYASTPVIRSVTPRNGAAGVTITINGINFNPNMQARFGSTNTPIRFISETRVIATAPASGLNRAVSVSLVGAGGVSSSPFANAWTRTRLTTLFVLSANNLTWAIPPGVTSITMTLIGGGGAGGRAFRTGGNVWGQGGGGGGFIRASNIRVTPGAIARLTVGRGGTVNNPATDGRETCRGNTAFGANGGASSFVQGSVQLVARGGEGGRNSDRSRVQDGVAEGGSTVIRGVGSSQAIGLRGGNAGVGMQNGGAGQQNGFRGVQYRAPGAGGAGHASGTGQHGGSGLLTSYTGGGGGGGGDGRSGGAGASGFQSGGNGEGRGNQFGQGGRGAGNVGSSAQPGCFSSSRRRGELFNTGSTTLPADAQEICGGAGGVTGRGRNNVQGNLDCQPCYNRNSCNCCNNCGQGRPNAGGGGGLFGGGGGGGGDSCAAGAGAGGNGVIIMTF